MDFVVFGAGKRGKLVASYFKEIRKEDRIIAFLDNEKEGFVENIRIFKPEEIKRLSFDKIIITPGRKFVDEMTKQLMNLGVEKSKISSLYQNKDIFIEVCSKLQGIDESDDNVKWLKRYARFVREQNVLGSVAECGVNRGDFAYYINTYFQNRTLYLFDTFGGFDERDLEKERSLGNTMFLSSIFNSSECFRENDIEIVRRKMPHLDRCVFKKGYFPETTKGLDDSFVFVRLDMDLYQPMYEGLKFFYPKMIGGGVILLHDYFHVNLPGVKQAVIQYEKDFNVQLCKLPVADDVSLAIIRP